VLRETYSSLQTENSLKQSTVCELKKLQPVSYNWTRISCNGLSDLNSFVGKFVNLWPSGRDASLHLKTCDGKATIYLQLGLGRHHPPPFSQPPPRHVPWPSRQRRMQRRVLVCEQAEQAQAKTNVEEFAENANEKVDKDES
jgi:hypothetical protein